ncbi:MAG TPA: 3-phosphoserine/phosphohydroxythreonine transaminase [Roseiflexaceae bacterium]|nr:3-phosphoserine/phosphohydroxythreonine transaminase [Roseiflexaceae bacterium]HMP43281.1 3-phosphoserine/phosphohydroxythreonine transaminase [Roseiflexaceae bacterium]
MTTIYNFNAGPAIMPAAVLQQIRHELLDYNGIGMSILEISHRSQEFETINRAAEARLLRLLGLEGDYQVLFLQGGASMQFAMLPLNFLFPDSCADYILTGVWAEKAYEEAARIGTANIAASTRDEQYRRIPTAAEIKLSDTAAYVHLTTNNTIYGTQWHTLPDVGKRPLVADMSSDILSRPIDARRFAMIYAGAQKNMGPSGVTVVIIRRDWLAQAGDSAPTMLRYSTHAKNNSLYNTPPVFGVYALNLVLQWIEDQGGLPAMQQHNEQKAALIYQAIDAGGGFYRGHAASGSRSLMNITFRLPDETLEHEFVRLSAANGFVGLAGHRSIGGIRASTYNAMTYEGCAALADFMQEFLRTHG